MNSVVLLSAAIIYCCTRNSIPLVVLYCNLADCWQCAQGAYEQPLQMVMSMRGDVGRNHYKLSALQASACFAGVQ
jgi:hypothetical protein